MCPVHCRGDCWCWAHSLHGESACIAKQGYPEYKAFYQTNSIGPCGCLCPRWPSAAPLQQADSLLHSLCTKMSTSLTPDQCFAWHKGCFLTFAFFIRHCPACSIYLGLFIRHRYRFHSALGCRWDCTSRVLGWLGVWKRTKKSRWICAHMSVWLVSMYMSQYIFYKEVVDGPLLWGVSKTTVNLLDALNLTKTIWVVLYYYYCLLLLLLLLKLIF